MKKLFVALGLVGVFAACSGRIAPVQEHHDTRPFEEQLAPNDPPRQDAPELTPACPKNDLKCDSPIGAGFCFAGTCAVCVDGTDDAHCVSAYGPGHVCAGGACVAGTCHASADCVGDQLCVDHACAPCGADSDCQADTLYGPLSMCVAGSCAPAQCSTPNTTCAGVSGGQGVGRFCCETGTTATCVSGDCCDDAQCTPTAPRCINHRCQ